MADGVYHGPPQPKRATPPRGGECRNYRGQPKIVYATRAEAQAVVDRLQSMAHASTRRPYQPYRCQYGHDGWHVGRKPRVS